MEQENQPTPDQTLKPPLDIKIEAREDGTVHIVFNQPVISLGFTTQDTAQFIAGLSNCLMQALSMPPKSLLQDESGKPL